MFPDDLVLTGRRARVSKFVEGRSFVALITTLILLNAVTLGLETDKALVDAYGDWLGFADKLILGIFTLELGLKFYAYRLAFFRSYWNVFDLVIISVSWLPTNGTLAILRTLRVLRVLRLISVVPQLRRVVSAIGHSIPGMVSVVSILLLIFYVAAVLATKLFGTYPDPNMAEWFGTVGASAYTLFQIMTLESWSMGIVRPTMELFPWAWAFFLPFIVITSFAVLNFFIGIIVDSMQIAHEREAAENTTDEDKPITQKEYKILLARMDEIQGQLAAQPKGSERPNKR